MSSPEDWTFDGVFVLRINTTGPEKVHLRAGIESRKIVLDEPYVSAVPFKKKLLSFVPGEACAEFLTLQTA